MMGNDRKIMFILAAISAIIGVMLATQLRSNLSPQHTESRNITELRSTLQKELEKHKNLLADISKYELLYYQYETALDDGESVEVMKEELARARKLAGMVSLQGPGITVEIVDAVFPANRLPTDHLRESAEGNTSGQPEQDITQDALFADPEGQPSAGLEHGSDFTENEGAGEPVSGGNLGVSAGMADGEAAPPLLIDGDLHWLVNELLVNGAKAVAINGHRLTATSAIRNVGPNIQVNTKVIRPPYVIKALGDPDTLISGLKLANIEGYFQLVNKTVRLEKHEQLYIPAYQEEPTVRYMRPVKAKGDS
jgi:uncharacterized protein YlxW (UPF0749 family)